MKNLLFLTASFVLTFAHIASASESCVQDKYQIYFGNVGRLIHKAIKNAKVEPKCDGRVCVFVVSNFKSYSETDGCGGGTTGYGTSFQYVDGKTYEQKYCVGGEGRMKEKLSENIGAKLNQVLVELNLQKSVGYISSINVTKVECLTNSNNESKEGSFAHCKVYPANEGEQ